MAMYDSGGNQKVETDSISVYHFGIENEGDVTKILFNDLFQGLVEDILKGLSRE